MTTTQGNGSPNGASNGRIPVSWAFHIIGWLSAMLLAYGMARADIRELQTKQTNTDRRLERIEDKVDAILERVR